MKHVALTKEFVEETFMQPTIVDCVDELGLWDYPFSMVDRLIVTAELRLKQVLAIIQYYTEGGKIDVDSTGNGYTVSLVDDSGLIMRSYYTKKRLIKNVDIIDKNKNLLETTSYHYDSEDRVIKERFLGEVTLECFFDVTGCIRTINRGEDISFVNDDKGHTVSYVSATSGNKGTKIDSIDNGLHTRIWNVVRKDGSEYTELDFIIPLHKSHHLFNETTKGVSNETMAT